MAIHLLIFDQGLRCILHGIIRMISLHSINRVEYIEITERYARSWRDLEKTDR